jgi:hypothetical protein
LPVEEEGTKGTKKFVFVLVAVVATFVAFVAVVAVVAVVADPTVTVAGSTYCGAEAPARRRNPAVPSVKNVLVPDAVL